MNDGLRLAFTLVSSLAVLAIGCSDGTEPVVTQFSLPADVAGVLQSRCVSCHASTPRFGAPMPLMTWADTQRSAPSAPSRKVWQLVGERVHDVARPMPPTRLEATELAIIDAWVRAGAPGCSGSACGSVRDTPRIDAPMLPCTPSHTFTAHAEGTTSGFMVPAASGNLNKCFAFRSPFSGTTQATAFGPRINAASVLHHMILFATETPQREGAVFNCEGNMPRDARFVTGWAPGNNGTVLPPDVGVELPGEGSWFILQVHYWNLQPQSATDESGIALCTTNEVRPHTAAVTTLGSLNIAIPPRAQDHVVTGTCTPMLREPVHIIGSGPHMHRFGTSLRTDVFRGGNPARRDMVVNVERYSFDAQVPYRSDVVVMPGDVVHTECRYNNPSNRMVYFGERTEDEMCFNFVLAWPAGALVNAGGVAARRCIDRML